jgi:rod shape-determining protein MreD
VKYALLAVFAWFLSVLSVTFMPHIELLGVSPDLVLALACCWAVMRSEEEALIGVPIVAVIRDLITSDPVGTSLLAMAPIALFAALARQRPIESAFLPTLAVVAGSTLTFELIHAAVLAITGQPIDIGYLVLRVAIPAAVVNALFTPIIYLPVRWLSPARPSVLYGSGRLTSPL